jgi:hypothetical protein
MSVPEEQLFPRGREDCEPRFWTILQESFYASYVHRGYQLSQHRMLQFTALRAAAAGEAILPFFDYQRGLVDLVTRRSHYVPDWVRFFYATVYIDADRVAIRFMFMGQQQRLNREGISELLQVDLHDDSIHYLAYPDVEPPRRAHSPVLPSDDEISFLFQQLFLPGTPRTPDHLIREAYVVHYALRRSVLYRMGNTESLTGEQQLLLMYVMAKHPFDLVDIMLAEIEDAIMDGMGMTRQQPFAHWISWLLSRLEAQRYVGMLESSKFVFPTYQPPMLGDRRRGPRGLRRAEETLLALEAAEAVMDEAARQDATLAAAEAPLPQYFATDDESSSDDEDFTPAPEPVFRVRRTHEDEAGGSTLLGQREAESPVPTITTAQVSQPDQLTTLIQTMAAQTQRTLQVQQQMHAQFQQYQESQQVIFQGIRQQQEAERQQMLQHKMMTSQMFTFMSGCLGQLFQQSGI